MIALANLGIAVALGIVAFVFGSHTVHTVFAGQIAIGAIAVVNSFDLISARLKWRCGIVSVPPVLQSRMVEFISLIIALGVALAYAL
jgi:hypothetical protein